MRTPSHRSWSRPVVALMGLVALTGTTVAASGSAVGSEVGLDVPPRLVAPSGHLDLGPSGLRETRTTRTVQPGVTLTRITRGSTDESLFWTLESLIDSTGTSPDPDAPARVLSDRASARATAGRLRADGFSPRVEAVEQPVVADVPAGILGYRVRVGSYPTKAAADRVNVELAASGETASTVYTGWDGDSGARGPWRINVVRIAPARSPALSQRPSAPTCTTGRRRLRCPEPPVPQSGSTVATSSWIPRPVLPAIPRGSVSTTVTFFQNPLTPGLR